MYSSVSFPVAAIQPYQSGLLDQIRKSIEQLNTLVVGSSYPDSEASRIARLYDIPKLAGSVIWSRQIEHQLDKYLDRAAILLGPMWDNHQEGRKFKVRPGEEAES